MTTGCLKCLHSCLMCECVASTVEATADSWRYTPRPLIFPIQREQRVSPATRNMQHATVEGFSVVVFCCVLFSFIFLCVFFTPEVLGHEFNPIGVSGSRKSPICGKFSTNLACTYLRNFLGNCKIVSYQQYFLQYFRHVSFHRIFF